MFLKSGLAIYAARGLRSGTAEITAVVWLATLIEKWVAEAGHLPGGFKYEFGGGSRVQKKCVSMRKLNLRELNAENCVNLRSMQRFPGKKPFFPLENSDKSLTRGSRASRPAGPLGPGPWGRKTQKENRQRVANKQKTPKKTWKMVIFDSFSSFCLTPGPRGSGNPLSDFFRSFLGRGLLTPVGGQRCRKTWAPSELIWKQSRYPSPK